MVVSSIEASEKDETTKEKYRQSNGDFNWRPHNQDDVDELYNLDFRGGAFMPLHQEILEYW